MNITIDNHTYHLDDDTAAAIRALLPKEAGRWKPQYDDKYLTLDDAGRLSGTLWRNNPIDKFAYLRGEVFRTEAEAAAHLRHLEAVAELRATSEFQPDFSDKSQDKWYVHYDHYENKLIYGATNGYQYAIPIWYPTEEAAQASIRDHAAAWLVVFGVEADA